MVDLQVVAAAAVVLAVAPAVDLDLVDSVEAAVDAVAPAECSRQPSPHASTT